MKVDAILTVFNVNDCFFISMDTIVSANYNIAFSHDVMAAMLMYQNKGRVAILV